MPFLATARCADCNAMGETLEHSPTCPLLVARRRVIEWDRAFFAANPDAAARMRAVHPAEREELRALGLSIAPGTNGDEWVTVVTADDAQLNALIYRDGKLVAVLGAS